MNYILFVILSIFTEAGMPKDSALIACVLTTALFSIYMGIYINNPVSIFRIGPDSFLLFLSMWKSTSSKANCIRSSMHFWNYIFYIICNKDSSVNY
jgi:hypothetical protein